MLIFLLCTLLALYYNSEPCDMYNDAVKPPKMVQTKGVEKKKCCICCFEKA